jgi:indole-3-glycerol phosphate synthase
MCGRPAAFRDDALIFLRGYAPKSLGHSPEKRAICFGKSETFRTSGGGAAGEIEFKIFCSHRWPTACQTFSEEFGSEGKLKPSPENLQKVWGFMNDILEQIVARKRERLEEAKRRLPQERLLAELPTVVGGGRFVSALRRDAVNIIAEIKRRSPSKGVIRENFDPGKIARNYSDNGAAAISCLTEEDFFDGSLEHLHKAREITPLPLLRKDFVFDEYQIYEATHAGADAILLIAAMLDGARLNDLLQTAYSLGLDVLVEVHNREELEKALCSDVRLLGINNRNLRTFETTLDTSLRLAAEAPKEVVLVSESGIRTREDIDRLREAGFHAFLIGEELMRAEDEGKALRELVA